MTRWSGWCLNCRRERKLQTRYTHAAKALCDDCAAKPHCLPRATWARKAVRVAPEPLRGALADEVAFFANGPVDGAAVVCELMGWEKAA